MNMGAWRAFICFDSGAKRSQRFSSPGSDTAMARTRAAAMPPNLDEIFPLRIPKQVLKVTGKPEFDAVIGLLSVRFEMLGQRVNQSGLHVRRPKRVAR